MFGDYERRFIVPIKINRMTRHQAAEDQFEGGIGRLPHPEMRTRILVLAP